MAAGDSTPRTTAKAATAPSSDEAVDTGTVIHEDPEADYTAQLIEDLRRHLFLADRIGRVA